MISQLGSEYYFAYTWSEYQHNQKEEPTTSQYTSHNFRLLKNKTKIRKICSLK